MQNILSTIEHLALVYAQSHGFRPFDHAIELDLFVPWSIRDAINKSFTEMAMMISGQSGEVINNLNTGEFKFTKLRLPSNIIMNIYDGENFVIRLTNEPPASGQQLELGGGVMGKYDVVPDSGCKVVTMNCGEKAA